MIRLHIIAEGQTEEEFVNSILAEHLGNFNISTDVRCVETSRSRQRIYRGGSIDYARAKKDLQRWMKEDRNSDARFTTMIDLYALPDDFPKFEETKTIPDPFDRVRQLERAFQQDLEDDRFIPYLQLFEFEALILTEPSQFIHYFSEFDREIRQLIELTEKYDTPEAIDDGKETAPSKRILALIPEYAGKKVAAAPIIARKIGVEKMRRKCPHFHDWLLQLENLESDRAD